MNALRAAAELVSLALFVALIAIWAAIAIHVMS
jgi:hypothetical protein